jgi:hypothetical protein
MKSRASGSWNVSGRQRLTRFRRWVDRRDDEDVEVVDQLARLRMDRVVAQQAFGRLEAGDRRDPLARVLLAVDEDADLGAVALLADPEHLHLERRAVDVRRGVEEVRQARARRGLGDAVAGDREAAVRPSASRPPRCRR